MGKPARELVNRCGTALAERPVWLFSGGPVGDPPKPDGDPVDVAELLTATGAREHRVLADKLVRRQLSFRDRTEITRWAASIAIALQAVESSRL
jgi:menaquinone-dependent protoporphyrinogen oxidase